MSASFFAALVVAIIALVKKQQLKKAIQWRKAPFKLIKF